MGRPNLRIIRIDEGEQSLVKGIENMFNKVKEEKFSNVNNEMPRKVKEVYRTPNRLGEKRKSVWHITTKTVNVCNKENKKKVSREKD